jgi:formate-dependent phosphoribosylglycinamide formyltransferase (GAR transformylase)
MSEELVKRLRSGLTHNNQAWPEMCNEAADAIEVLTARLAEAEEALRGNAAFIKAQAEERARVRAETLEEAAKVADEGCRIWGEPRCNAAEEIAVAIRALATQENTDD